MNGTKSVKHSKNGLMKGLSDSMLEEGLVEVNTSLPPKVEGQLRCYLKMMVPQVHWLTPSKPSDLRVQVLWWGEEGRGTVFRPVDISISADDTTGTTARYGIRSGPKQFAAYLNDMGSLVLTVRSDASKQKILGQAEIQNISSLTPSKPISGIYSVFSSTVARKKIAELKVVIILESLMAAYDGTSADPTPDMSLDFYGAAVPSAEVTSPYQHNESLTEHNTAADLSAAAAAAVSAAAVTTAASAVDITAVGFSAAGTMEANPPPGTETVKSKLSVKSSPRKISGSLNSRASSRSPIRVGGDGDPREGVLVIRPAILHPLSEKSPNKYVKSGNQEANAAQKNEKGDRLRNAMIISTVSGVTNAVDQGERSSSAPIGILHSNLRNNSVDEEGLELLDHEPIESEVDCLPLHLLQPYNQHDMYMSDESINAEHLMNSDVDDPIHDTSLLEQLFYKQLSDDDEAEAGNRQPSIRYPNTDTMKSGSASRIPVISQNRGRGVAKSGRGGGRTKPLPGDVGRGGARAVSENRVTGQESRRGAGRGRRGRGKKRRQRVVESDSSAGRRNPASLMNSMIVDDSHLNEESGAVDGLSVERLTLLSKVHIARVIIESLLLNRDDSSQGFTPSEYVVECSFPVMADDSQVSKMQSCDCSDVIRASSINISSDNNVAEFDHCSVFPVLFTGRSLEIWWESDLVFNVFSVSDSDQMDFLGRSIVNLKSLLKAESLMLDTSLSVVLNNSPSEEYSRSAGFLKVCVELSSRSEDFLMALADTQLSEASQSRRIVPIPPTSQLLLHTSRSKSVEPTYPRGRDRAETLKNSKARSHSVTRGDFALYQEISVHVLLLIEEGTNITVPHNAVCAMIDAGVDGERDPSVYTVVRAPWMTQSSVSDVCSSTSHPLINSVQMTQINLSPSLLDKFRNNFAVIEIWNKKKSGEDKLIGLVKLPLNQIYASYRDRRIAVSLLKAQYPVTTVDGEFVIVNPYTRSEHGKLKVLLTVGSHHQVTSVLTNRKTDQSRNLNSVNGGKASDIVEHTFDVSIERLTGLKLSDDFMWGEADCFIKYYFPEQSKQRLHGLPSSTYSSLASFTTGTTLCVPDPVFNYRHRHNIHLPRTASIQQEILTASSASNVGSSGGSGVTVEFWCRFYQPNAHDQLVATATLSLAKLCGMTSRNSGKKSSEVITQSFSLALHPVLQHKYSEDSSQILKEGGTIEMSISYRYSTQKSLSNGASRTGSKRSLDDSIRSSVCSISVSVMRACGLKTAVDVALLAASSGADRSLGNPALLRHASSVGLNSYVTARLSFLQHKQDVRCTRTVARSFTPEYCSQFDFSSPVVWDVGEGGERVSLAEILESSEAMLELWHKPTSTDFYDQHDTSNNMRQNSYSDTHDILLGTLSVPLCQLLQQRTGINGWYPLTTVYSTPRGDEESRHHSSHVSSTLQKLERVVGGVELSIKFSRHTDLELVLSAAEQLDWDNIGCYANLHNGFDDVDQEKNESLTFNVRVDSVTFPHSLTAGSHLNDESYNNALLWSESSSVAYLRYKFFDLDAVCSSPVPIVIRNGYVSVELKLDNKITLPISTPLLWYLKEESLELQVCMTDLTTRMSHSIKYPSESCHLIGSARISLYNLANHNTAPHLISGIFPLFKPGVSSMDGACLLAHVSVTTASATNQSRDVGGLRSDASHMLSTMSADQMNSEKVFPVHISIERAFHLPMVLDGSEGVKPSSYVSYQTAVSDELTYTSIIQSCNHPVWCHDNDTYLSRHLLNTSNTSLVFKVWHKAQGVEQIPDKSVDKVLGFVSVDLTPLTNGFPNICGCYNIIDFKGLCQGQIKVAVAPLVSLDKKSSTLTPAHTLISSTAFLPFSSTWKTHSTSSLLNTGSLPQSADSSAPASARFTEHLQNVRLYHSEITKKRDFEALIKDDDNEKSKSMLFNTLRDNLKDLDDIVQGMCTRLEGKQLISGNESPVNDDVTSHLGSTGETCVSRDAVIELMRQTLEHTTSTHSSLPFNAYTVPELPSHSSRMLQTVETTVEDSSWVNHQKWHPAHGASAEHFLHDDDVTSLERARALIGAMSDPVAGPLSNANHSKHIQSNGSRESEKTKLKENPDNGNSFQKGVNEDKPANLNKNDESNLIDFTDMRLEISDREQDRDYLYSIDNNYSDYVMNDHNDINHYNHNTDELHNSGGILNSNIDSNGPDNNHTDINIDSDKLSTHYRHIVDYDDVIDDDNEGGWHHRRHLGNNNNDEGNQTNIWNLRTSQHMEEEYDNNAYKKDYVDDDVNDNVNDDVDDDNIDDDDDDDDGGSVGSDVSSLVITTLNDVTLNDVTLLNESRNILSDDESHQYYEQNDNENEDYILEDSHINHDEFNFKSDVRDSFFGIMTPDLGQNSARISSRNEEHDKGEDEMKITEYLATDQDLDQKEIIDINKDSVNVESADEESLSQLIEGNVVSSIDTLQDIVARNESFLNTQKPQKKSTNAVDDDSQFSPRDRVYTDSPVTSASSVDAAVSVSSSCITAPAANTSNVTTSAAVNSSVVTTTAVMTDCKTTSAVVTGNKTAAFTTDCITSTAAVSITAAACTSSITLPADITRSLTTAAVSKGSITTTAASIGNITAAGVNISSLTAAVVSSGINAASSISDNVTRTASTGNITLKDTSAGQKIIATSSPVSKTLASVSTGNATAVTINSISLAAVVPGGDYSVSSSGRNKQTDTSFYQGNKAGSIYSTSNSKMDSKTYATSHSAGNSPRTDIDRTIIGARGDGVWNVTGAEPLDQCSLQKKTIAVTSACGSTVSSVHAVNVDPLTSSSTPSNFSTNNTTPASNASVLKPPSGSKTIIPKMVSFSSDPAVVNNSLTAAVSMVSSQPAVSRSTAAASAVTHSSSIAVTTPSADSLNFFPDSKRLENSMRAVANGSRTLQLPDNLKHLYTSTNPITTSHLTLSADSRSPSRNHIPTPTPEQARRIAAIFSQKSEN